MELGWSFSWLAPICATGVGLLSQREPGQTLHDCTTRLQPTPHFMEVCPISSALCVQESEGFVAPIKGCEAFLRRGIHKQEAAVTRPGLNEKPSVKQVQSDCCREPGPDRQQEVKLMKSHFQQVSLKMRLMFLWLPCKPQGFLRRKECVRVTGWFACT